MKQQQILMPVIITAVIAGGVGFFGGMKFQQTQRTTQFGQFNGSRNTNGNRGTGMMGGRFGGTGIRPVSGEILSSDTNSITVKLTDGSSKIIMVSDKTTINKAAEATRADLSAGQQVAVFGTENSDGSVTAQNIQLNPMMRFGANGSAPQITPQSTK